MNYFEPILIYIYADSFHHQVQLSLKKQEKTNDFDFFELSQNLNFNSTTHNDFYLWKYFKSQPELKSPPSHTYCANKDHQTKVYSSIQNFTDKEDVKNLDLLYKKAMKKSGHFLLSFQNRLLSFQNHVVLQSRKRVISLKLIPEHRKKNG